MNKGLKIRLWREMKRVRVVEECIAEHYSEQEMRCPVHLSIGQEAAQAGACCALEHSDYVLSGHRSHGHYLAKGGDLNAMMAEIYGKAAGCASGKGGSMHLVDLDAGFIGAAPIVGSTIPIAVGSAFAAKARGEKRVTMVFLGDGATEAGVFYESVNFAAFKKLPIIFLVENNLYSVYSPLSVRQSEGERIVQIARAHGIPAQRADGNDIELCYELSKQAVDHARAGKGPTLLEFMTYRFREHCGPNYDNDMGYRTEAEFLSWQERCPIATYERRLVAEGVISAREIETTTRSLKAEAEAAIVLAKESPWPAASDLATHVYAD